MGNKLNKPIKSQHLSRKGDGRMRLGISSMQGQRPTMEDTHGALLRIPNFPHLSYKAVFDGHGGTYAAKFMAQNLPTYLSLCKNPTDPKELESVIQNMDNLFKYSKLDEKGNIVVITKEEEEKEENTEPPKIMPSGCTACIIIIDWTRYPLLWATIINLGDSRCIIFDSSNYQKFTTTDQKPDNDLESKHINACGGYVDFSTGCARVDGDLAMSRAIGDFHLKGFKNDKGIIGPVNNVPAISQLFINQHDRVFLCCDGLVEIMDNSELIYFINHAILKMSMSNNNNNEADFKKILSKIQHISFGHRKPKVVEKILCQSLPHFLTRKPLGFLKIKKSNTNKNSGIDPAAICASLNEYSLRLGSMDNMTCMLLLPDVPGQSYGATQEVFVPGRLRSIGSNKNGEDVDPDYKHTYVQDAKRHTGLINTSKEKIIKCALRLDQMIYDLVDHMEQDFTDSEDEDESSLFKDGNSDSDDDFFEDFGVPHPFNPLPSK